MRKVAVVNFKGGTGKTTTVVNIGAGLAKRGKRVLLVDVDAQGSLALSLGLAYSHSLTDILTNKAPIGECIFRARKNLDVIPSDNSLLQAQRALASQFDWQGVLRNTLQPIEESYDWILLDCAASITLLNINALTYANELFIPTQVEYLSLAGLNQVLENLARVRFPNRPRQEVIDLGISLIIPTMYDVRKRQSRLLLTELRQTYGRRVAHPIRINVRLSEAPSFQKTIFEYAPNSRGAFDYNRLTDLLLQETLLVGAQPIGLQQPFHPPVRPATIPVAAASPTIVGEEQEIATPTLQEPAVVPSQAAKPTSSAFPEWATAHNLPQCPYCNVQLASLEVAGYRVYHCKRCGYQKQVLQRDLRAH